VSVFYACVFLDRFIGVLETFLKKNHRGLCLKSGGHDLTKNSKKAKGAGLEQHRQALRAKKMKKKEKKKVTIPANYRKR